MAVRPLPLVTILIAGLVAAILFSGSPPQRGADASSTQPGLVVHEWGTFTALSQADGSMARWRPLDGPTDLPRFVYRRDRFRKDAVSGTLRLETPVVYFYSDRETTVSLEARFPEGKITEWYPQAVLTADGVAWQRFTVGPEAIGPFAREEAESHYYPARETDAAPLRAWSDSGHQYEKFLFYRGVGTFDLPLTIRLDGENVIVSGTGEIDTVLLVECRDGRFGYSVGHLSDGNGVLERPTAGDGTLDAFSGELATLLTTHGLFTREADAMIATWNSSWAEEGLRLFYVVPRRMTDAVLPLRIWPMPASLERVLVARVEIITPEMQQTIERHATLLGSPSAGVRDEAVQVLRKYGRFSEPILTRALEETRDDSVRRGILQYMTAQSSRL